MNRVTGRFVISNGDLSISQQNSDQLMDQEMTIADCIDELGKARPNPSLRLLDSLSEKLTPADLIFGFEQPSVSYDEFKRSPTYNIAVNFRTFFLENYFNSDEHDRCLIEDLAEATAICFEDLFKHHPADHPIAEAISESGATCLDDIVRHYEGYSDNNILTFLVLDPLRGPYYVPSAQYCLII